jgi:hypothetical protein
MTDGELIEFTREFREGVLNGGPSTFMCAVVCWPLESLLKIHGVNLSAQMTADVRMADGDTCNHVWLKLDDGRVLDPTADQFGDQYPAIYLGPPLIIHTGVQP